MTLEQRVAYLERQLELLGKLLMDFRQADLMRVAKIEEFKRLEPRTSELRKWWKEQKRQPEGS